MPRKSASSAATTGKAGRKGSQNDPVIEGDEMTQEELAAVKAGKGKADKEDKAPPPPPITDLVEMTPFVIPEVTDECWEKGRSEGPVMITPGMAKFLLAKFCDRNRRVRPNTVNEYADRILAGGFKQFSGNVLGFAKFDDGDLRSMVNGQHQCHALVLAAARLLKNPDMEVDVDGVNDLAIPMTVTFGIDPDSIPLLDHGTPRTHADVVQGSDAFVGIEDKDDLKKLSTMFATAAKIILFRTKYGKGVECRQKFQFHELAELNESDKFAWLKTACTEVLRISQNNKKITQPQGGVNASYLAAAAFSVYQVAKATKAKEFLAKVEEYYSLVGSDEMKKHLKDGEGVFNALAYYHEKGFEGMREQRLACVYAAAYAFLHGTVYNKKSDMDLSIPFKSLGKGDDLGDYRYRWIDADDHHQLTDVEIAERQLGEPGLPKGWKEHEAKGVKARFVHREGKSVVERFN